MVSKPSSATAVGQVIQRSQQEAEDQTVTERAGIEESAKDCPRSANISTRSPERADPPSDAGGANAADSVSPAEVADSAYLVLPGTPPHSYARPEVSPARSPERWILALTGAAAIAAVGALVISGWGYWAASRAQRIAAVFSLFEELHNNLNVAGGGVLRNNEDEQQIRALVLEVLRMYARHPEHPLEHPASPCDNSESARRLLPIYANVLPKGRRTSPGEVHSLRLLRTSAIEHAMATGSIAPLVSPTVFIGLNHLLYSLQRHNDTVAKYNGLVDQDAVSFGEWIPEYELLGYRHSHTFGLDGVRAEYMFWVHFRLYLTMVDLVLSAYGTSALPYRGPVEHIRKSAGDIWPRFPTWTRWAPRELRVRYLQRHARRHVDPREWSG